MKLELILTIARRGAHSDTLEAKNNLIRVLHFIGSDRSVTIVPLINPLFVKLIS